MLRKPDALKRVLLAHVPGLRDDPASLALFVDKGKVIARGTGSLSFEYGYTLNIVAQDYAGDIDALVLPILVWIAEAQPDLLDRAPNQPFTFESEILDGDTADVSIDLELTERVLVERNSEGGVNIRHLDDARVPDAFAGACGATLWQGLLVDEALATSEQMP
jgi:hypothetical protein